MVGRANADWLFHNLAIPTMTRTPCAGLLEGNSKRANRRKQQHSTCILSAEEPRDAKR